jgi:hypothetical protein
MVARLAGLLIGFAAVVAVGWIFWPRVGRAVVGTGPMDYGRAVAAPSPTPTAIVQPVAEPTQVVAGGTAAAAKPGEQVKVDDIEVVVLGAKAARRLAVQPAPGNVNGAFVGVDVWAENKSGSVAALPAGATLVGDDGTSYSVASGVEERHGAISQTFAGPGVNQGYLIFDAPSGKSYQLRLASKSGEVRTIALGNVGEPLDELVPLGRHSIAVAAGSSEGTTESAALVKSPPASAPAMAGTPAAGPLPQLYPTPPTGSASYDRSSDADYRE